MNDERRPAVCIIRHNYYPDTHVRRDAETLAQVGYRVSVITLRRPGQTATELLNGVEVHRLPVGHRRGGPLRYLWEYLSFFILAFLTVTALHVRRRFRVVEVDNMPDVLVFAALIPKLLGARVIFYIFDNMPELLVVARGYRPWHPLVRLLAWIERLSASFADRVIVTQDTARRVVQARGVAPDKISVVLNCPDETVFNQLARRDSARSSDHFELVTHGAILERYGIQVLIDALPRIAEQIPTVRLQVFGEGEYRRALEERARRNGVADRVRFRGLVPLAELIDGLASADVGYVGMLCDLMLSNKLMEYVALGVPVALARWPTYERYFPDNSVSYFPPGNATGLADAIIRIHENPDLTRQKATGAQSLYLGYRWTVQRDAYLSIYANLPSQSVEPAADASAGMVSE